MNRKATIIKVLHGSNLFGTATKSSDLDTKSIFIPAASDILLGKIGSTDHEGTTNRQGKNTASDTDQDNHDAAKFVRMLQTGSPESLEILFAPESAYLQPPLREWETIIEKRKTLLHAETSAFESIIRRTSSIVQLGEAEWKASHKMLQRINSEIEAGRKKEAVERHVERLIEAAANSSVVDRATRVGSDGVSHQYLRVANKYIPVGESLAFAQKLTFGIMQEAQSNKANGGFSPTQWKHLSHSVRLSFQMLELLEKKSLTFPRPEKELLLEIKLGLHTEDQIREILSGLSTRLDIAKQTTDLPHQPDEAIFDELIVEVHLSQVKDHFELVTKQDCNASNSLSLS